jgi:hypothetical protein
MNRVPGGGHNGQAERPTNPTRHWVFPAQLRRLSTLKPRPG